MEALYGILIVLGLMFVVIGLMFVGRYAVGHGVYGEGRCPHCGCLLQDWDDDYCGYVDSVCHKCGVHLECYLNDDFPGFVKSHLKFW